MTLQINGGDLLIDSGSLANSADCCCDDCCGSFEDSGATITLSLGSACCTGFSGDYVLPDGAGFGGPVGNQPPLGCSTGCDFVEPARTVEQCHNDLSCYQRSLGDAANTVQYIFNEAWITISYGCNNGEIVVLVVITWYQSVWSDSDLVPGLRDCVVDGAFPSGPTHAIRLTYPSCDTDSPAPVVYDDSNAPWFPGCSNPSMSVAFD